MADTSRSRAGFPLFFFFAATAYAAAGCAHASTAASLTSAQAPAAPAAPPAEVPKPEPVTPATPPTEEAAPKPKKAEPQALSFEQLSAQLGGDDKLALDSNGIGDGSTVAQPGKGLSANGYAAV